MSCDCSRATNLMHELQKTQILPRQSKTLHEQRRGLREGRHFLEELVEQHTSLQWVYVLELLGARQICAQAQPLNSSDLSLSLRLCLLPPSQ
jgi:hypothetical protein